MNTLRACRYARTPFQNAQADARLVRRASSQTLQDCSALMGACAITDLILKSRQDAAGPTALPSTHATSGWTDHQAFTRPKIEAIEQMGHTFDEGSTDNAILSIGPARPRSQRHRTTARQGARPAHGLARVRAKPSKRAALRLAI